MSSSIIWWVTCHVGITSSVLGYQMWGYKPCGHDKHQFGISNDGLQAYMDLANSVSGYHMVGYNIETYVGMTNSVLDVIWRVPNLYGRDKVFGDIL